MRALSYLLEIQRTGIIELIDLTKEIWRHFLILNFTMTAEYLHSSVEADRQSRKKSEWKLLPKCFTNMQSKRGTRTRFICIWSVESTAKVHGLETQSI